MPEFLSDDLRLTYYDQGSGEPVLFLHGFASTAAMSWERSGWVEAALAAGRRVIMLDHRGHGASEKPYEPALYSSVYMADDAARLIAHLGLQQVDVMGYSMGARVSAFLAIKHPHLVRSLVFGGMGTRLLKQGNSPSATIAALEAEDPETIESRDALAFRTFAEKAGNDLKALACVLKGPRTLIERDALLALQHPILVAVGTDDHIGGSASEMAAQFTNGEALDIPGRDHMRAPTHPLFKERVLAFWSERS